MKELPESYHKVSKVLQELNKLLPEHGLVAGGAARDIYHGVEPKDYDVVFSNKVTPSMVIDALSRITTTETSIIDTFNFHSKRKHFADEDTQVSCCSSDDRILHGIKVRVDDSPEIDLLIYNVASITEIPSMFDYNINQFVMLMGEPRFVGAFHPAEVGLLPARGLGESPRDVKRLEKLKAIAKAYGYYVPQE